MEKMITIKNRSAGQVTYMIPEDGIRRSFAPGEAKRITSEELEHLTFQPGGKEILAGFLQVIEEEGRAIAGLTNVQPEYNMSEADVVKLIQTGSVDEFLDCLDFAPVGVIDLIKKLSVSIPLYDMQKRAALKKKTGFDVDAALRNIAAEKEDEDGTILKQAAPERRVKKEEVPAGRRTTPKYNVVTPKVEETAE